MLYFYIVNRPISFITISFLFGVFFSSYISLDAFSYTFIFYYIGLVFAILMYHFWLKKYSITPNYYSSVLIILFFIIGFYNYQLSYSKLNKRNDYFTHISNYSKNNFRGVLVKTLKPTNYYYRYIAETQTINSKKVEGKVLIKIPRSTNNTLKLGSVINIENSSLKGFLKPKNPFQFNYGTYMKDKGVYRQISVSKNEFHILSPSSFSFIRFVEEIKLQIRKNLLRSGFSKEALSIVNTLVLGDKTNLEKELIEDYQKAGVVHLMAISGLHIGLIMFLLNNLLKPLLWFKNGVKLRFWIVILLIWCFAFFTGFSASTTRSVTMFSFVLLALNFKRTINVTNNLLVSMFLLLLVKPSFINDIGFIMSYIAVFSIVLINPFFTAIWQPNSIVLKKGWGLASVTLSCQLGLLPILLYSFNQFSGLFLIANILIIPLVSICLPVCIIVSICAVFTPLPNFLGESVTFLIEFLNQSVKFFADKEAYFFSEIYFDKWMFLIISFSIFYLVCFLQTKKNKHIIVCLLALFVFQVYNSSLVIKLKSLDELVVFSAFGPSPISVKQGDKLKVITYDDKVTAFKNYSLKTYKTHRNIKWVDFYENQNILKIGDVWLLRINKNLTLDLPIKPTILVLSNSPKVNLNRVIENYFPKIIVMDSKNYPKIKKKWIKTIEKYNLAYHDVYTQGAFMYKLKK